MATNKKQFIGTVVSNKMQKTIIVTVESVKVHPKYHKRYRVSKKYAVHTDKQHQVGEKVTVNLKVANVDGFSGHSDRTQLINFARAIKPRPSKFFMLHGEESKCEDLARTIGKMLHVESRAPQVLDSMRLK